LSIITLELNEEEGKAIRKEGKKRKEEVLIFLMNKSEQLFRNLTHHLCVHELLITSNLLHS
jgi:hypothetical protein